MRGGAVWRCVTDHVVRVDAGGTENLDNLQLIHIKCHKAKTRMEDKSKAPGSCPSCSVEVEFPRQYCLDCLDPEMARIFRA